MKKRIVIIGNGKIAVDCAQVAGVSHSIVGFVTEPAGNLMGKSIVKVPKMMQPLETENVNAIADKIREMKPDLIFSINNFQLLKEEIISIPPLGIINFHNGPLPRYAGLNVCSWAIVNGEQEHGVTWHYVDSGVDSGEIVTQLKFPIGEDETALQLIMKCIQRGLHTFKEILPLVTSQRIRGTRQEWKGRTVYRRTDTPNNGAVSYRWESRRVYNFIRGLNFDPLENTFIRPSSVINGKKFYIDRICRAEEAPARNNYGEVIQANDQQILIQAADGHISLEKIRDENQTSLSLTQFIDEYKIKKGMMINE